MPSGEYERYRQHLDAQLRADVELIHEAYRAKLRAYETVARARGEEFAALPAADLSLDLPPALAPQIPGPPALVPAAGSAAPVPRAPAYQVEDAILEVLETLPEMFNSSTSSRFSVSSRGARLSIACSSGSCGRIRWSSEHYGTARIPTVYRKAAVPT
jgi:hypothetical protein